MSRIAVVGGHGQVALHLHPLLVDQGDTPIALVRSDGYRDELEALGAQVRLLDLEQADVSAFAAALSGCDAVVFAAGGGPDGNVERKRTVDLEGSVKAAEGAERAGVRRFVQISAIGVDEALPDDTDAVWRAYVEAKRGADASLRGTRLDWTILRPGRLTDGAPTGLVALGAVGREPGGEVTRGDVAAVVAAVLSDARTHGAQWDVLGGDLSIPEAVSAALRQQAG